MSTKAIIVIDIQNDYFPGGAFPLHKPEEAAQQAAKVINDARDKKVPVIFIRHISADPTKIPFFLPNTKGMEINDIVKPAEGEKIIDKFYPNSFLQTSLKEELDTLGVKELVLVGSMSHMCIQSTARYPADQYQYPVTVIEDACTCPAQSYGGVEVGPEQVHAVSMASLAFGFATIVNTEAYLAQ